ncbi:MAG: tetraacyldisaccharide 4'-kinase [Haliscomenobacter sp.]|nr:tetraacyldisaccharide 4'-kinase [Haliscomenobacter sp.]
MIQFSLLQFLLSPFALLYGLAVALRNLFYQVGILKSVSFNFPVISVGNLSMGGSGKTPHIEYLIRLLKEYIYIATLSRGYKRKTTGFLIARPEMNAEQIGDEPLQFVRKFPDITVAVGENRAFGIPQILSLRPHVQTILLDDAFQHRAVQPGLNMMLTEYRRPFTDDFLLPSGRLREWRSAYRRADIIVVSKCPEAMSLQERDRMRNKIRPLPHQRIFFSTYTYGHPYFLLNPAYAGALDQETDVLLLTGIANADYLAQHLEPLVGSLTHMEYEDHHYFEETELFQIQTRFKNLESGRKLILTTEKDAMRLELHRARIMELQLPIFVLPVEVQFLFGSGQEFDQAIKEFLIHFKI